MRKKILMLFLAIVSAVCLCIGISACNGDSSANGTYYEYKNDSYDYSSYIILKNGEWSDDSGASGTYSISGTTIVFYTVIFGENEEWMDGTISNGAITYYIGSTAYTYCKEGKSSSGNTESDSSGGSASSQYTVTYNANGGTFSDGSETYAQTISSGSTLTAPTSPTREGYSFAGWATSKNGSAMWSFSSDKVTSNMTLYASWIEKSASILSVDNATIDGSDILLVVDRYTDSVSLSSKIVCSSDSSWKLYYDKLGQTEIPTKIAASLSGSLSSGNNVFYIVVTSTDGTQVNLYTLTVHRSYAVTVYYYDGSNLLNSETAYTGYTFTTTYSPSITGYAFDYWKTSSSGSKKYTGETLWGNLSLYASKTANTYTVTYNVNGGDELAETTATVTYGSSYTLTVPTRTNYTFEGWYIGNTQITDSSGKSISAWNYTSGKTLTAKWSGDNYSVTLNRSDSSAGTVTGNGSHSYASSVTIKATTNNGYTWVGWYDADDELITTETSYTFTMPAENVSYVAKWTYYTLTTAANDSEAGSVIEYSNTKTTAGNRITITATTNSGYTFVGWYDGDAKLTSELNYTFTMPAENIAYTAKWIETTVTVISSDASIGTVRGITNTNNILGNSVTITATAVNLGYNFLGWYNGETKFTDEYSCTITISETKTDYIAKYELDPAMSNLMFTSTTTTCSITGINDKTVTEIIVPDYVTSISQGAFSGCSNLISITLPFAGGNVNATEASASTLFGYIFGSSSFTNSVATKQNYTDGGTNTISTYYIPKTLTTVTITGQIISCTFYNCSLIESVAIIDGATSIGSYAFWGCTSLTSVTIGNNVTSIGYAAFGKCTSLTSITIGSGVTSIGSNPFYETAYYNNSNNWENNVLYIGNYLIKAKTSISGDYTIKDGTTVIADSAFSDCTKLTSITIPDSVTFIGDEAFYNCTSLIYNEYENGYYLGNDNNKYIVLIGIIDASIESFTFNDNVKSIHYKAFYNCTSLTSVTV